MRSTRTQTLIILGLVVGLVAGMALAAQFAPGDAVEVSDGVPLGAPDGMNATIHGTTNVSMENFTPNSRTVELHTEAGNISLASDAPAWATVHTSNMACAWTNLAAITAGSTWIEVYPEDKQRVDTSGDVNQLSVRSMAVDDATADLWYEGSDGGTVSVRIYGLPANTQVGAYDANSGTLLDGDTTTASGVVTFEMPASSHTVELQTVSSDPPTFANASPADGATVRSEDQTLSIDVDDPNFQQGDEVTVSFAVNGSVVDSQTITSAQTVSTSVGGLSEGDQDWTVTAEDAWGNTTSATYSFTVDHYDPVISSLSPTGLLDANPSTLSAAISDRDFGLDGDELDVTFSLNGTQIHSETISGNQTVDTATPQSGLTGGVHEYTVSVTDDYGHTVSQTETYTVPDTLYIRNELNHSTLVNTGTTFNLTFYGPDTSYSRTTSDGTLKMTGLPVNNDYIVVATPSNENYTTRALWVNNIYEQQSVYLLDTRDVNTIESRLVLEDPTGQYGSQSVVAVQRSIEINGTAQWQTVHSDQFGVEGVTVTLEEGVRYRTKIIAEDGTQQVVGPYRAEVSETVTVRPGAPEIDIPAFNDGYGYSAQLENVTAQYRYDDPQNQTDSVTVWIHEKGNESNQLVANSSFYDVGSVYNEFTIGTNQSKKTWVVNFVITRGGGETVVQSRTIANQKQLFDPLAPGLQAAVGVMLLILLAGAFSVLNAGVGAVAVSLTGGLLWWVGLLSGVASGILIAISMFLSVAYYLATNSGP